MEIELETIRELVGISKEIEENALYLTYSVNPIGTYPSKDIILKDVEIIRNLLNQIEELL